MINHDQAAQAMPAKSPFVAAAEAICNDSISGHKVGLLVSAALHRVTEMEEDELRKFLPWLLFNDGELAGASRSQLMALQAVIASGLPPTTWPRP